VREHYWDKILKYLDGGEQNFVAVCKDSRTSASARGRLFENLVIMASLNPSRQPKLQLDDGKSVILPHISKFLEGSELPQVPEVPMTYIPENENFPAIDFILSFKDFIVAVQVHTSSHRDVLEDFEIMCEEAKRGKEIL
jgi:hypothetical protein